MKKKPYTKPRLRVVELETREIMAMSCKTMSGAPNMQKPNHCGIQQGCMEDGS